MKRALVIALLAVGCTPTVVLGTLGVDAGGGFDIGGSCAFCDLGGVPLDGFPTDGGFGANSDLADGGLLVDLAH